MFTIVLNWSKCTVLLSGVLWWGVSWCQSASLASATTTADTLPLCQGCVTCGQLRARTEPAPYPLPSNSFSVPTLGVAQTFRYKCSALQFRTFFDQYNCKLFVVLLLNYSECIWLNILKNNGLYWPSIYYLFSNCAFLFYAFFLPITFCFTLVSLFLSLGFYLCSGLDLEHLSIGAIKS